MSLRGPLRETPELSSLWGLRELMLIDYPNAKARPRRFPRPSGVSRRGPRSTYNIFSKYTAPGSGL